MLTISPTSFKSDYTQSSSMFNQKNNAAPPFPVDYGEDSLELMSLEKDLQKKQRRQENLQKWGVYGTCAIGGALILQLLLSVYGMYKTAKGAGSKNLKMVWEDFAKKEDFPKLTDDCVNENVRKFIQTIKDTTGLSSEVMKKAGVDAPEQCIIMWGPSGTGKTFSAKMLAKEINAEYSEVQFADVSSPFIGQTSVEIQGVFKRLADKARKNPNKKFLVAFNEIDALLVPREKCGSNNLHLAENRTAFLNGLDQIKEFKNIKIVGTTNVNPDSGNLDKASLSRFGNILKIGLPDEKEIVASLKFHMQKSEDVKNGKFFENNKSKLEAFAKELMDKKYAHRDIEDIAKKARATYAIDLQNKKTTEFNLKYLEDAVKVKGKPVGAIEEEIPIWERYNLEHPEPDGIEPEKAISLWKKILARIRNK